MCELKEKSKVNFQETMSHGGDILKFSGDAFLVIYKKSDTVPMRDAVHEAIDCGLIIQKSYGNYTTDVGIVIRGIQNCTQNDV